MTIYASVADSAASVETEPKFVRKAARPLERTKHFANRELETKKIDDTLNLLRHGGDRHHCIVNFFGVPGIGKTELLANIKEQFLGRRFSGLYCNLETISSTDLLSAKQQFLSHLNQSIALVDPPNRQHAQPGAPAGIPDEASLDLALDHLAGYLSSLDQVLLLIVDSWEHVQETLFAWFEWRLLLPLIARGRLVGVFGSQAPLRWRQFDVRRRVEPCPLEPLDTSATREQLDVSPEVATAVYQITFGHPLANETVRTLLEATDAPARYLDTYQHTIAAKVVDTLLQRARVERASELQSILQTAALLREFDVNTLRVILPSAFPVFRNRSQSALMLAIRQLAETRMIRWDDQRRAYQLDATLRAIFTRELQLNHPDWYTALRNAAINFYAGLIEEVPSRRHEYMIELLYQTLHKPDWNTYDASEIQATFAAHVKRYYGAAGADPALTRLRSLLSDDQELRTALRERDLSPTLFLDRLR